MAGVGAGDLVVHFGGNGPHRGGADRCDSVYLWYSSSFLIFRQLTLIYLMRLPRRRRERELRRRNLDTFDFFTICADRLTTLLDLIRLKCVMLTHLSGVMLGFQILGIEVAMGCSPSGREFVSIRAICELLGISEVSRIAD